MGDLSLHTSGNKQKHYQCVCTNWVYVKLYVDTECHLFNGEKLKILAYCSHLFVCNN